MLTPITSSKNSRIRVLIVDDSFFTKKLLRKILESDTEIEVIDEASDGYEAITKALILKPDVITLDYNLPGLNGASVIKKLLDQEKENPPAIVMISAYTHEGSQVALECLREGAIECIQKPSGELSLNLEILTAEIIEKVKIASIALVRRYQPVSVKTHAKKVPVCTSSKVVVIGASTGGPPVVEHILSELPSDLCAPVLVAQHMPDFFLDGFSKRLNDICPLAVKMAASDNLLTPGFVYIVPSGQNLLLTGSYQDAKIILEPFKEIPKPSPSINNLFSEAVEIYQSQTIGIILTGMGDDGSLGAKKIKSAGGKIIAQDPNSCAIKSMPESVIQAGLADVILPPEKIANKLIEYINS